MYANLDFYSKIQLYIFRFFVVSSYLLIVLIFIGIQIPHKIYSYYHTIDFYTRIYICIFLLWRFNPFQKIKFNELDRHIAFSAGLVILSTTILNNYLVQLKEKIQNKIETHKIMMTQSSL
jgi:hypothetical protein